MFNNKKDPLIDSVKKVMAENESRRQAELDLNEELGIASKRALPHEHHANYDALLEQRIAEALHPNQQKLDVHEPEKDKLTAQDFKMLRAKKKPMEEAIGDKEGTAGTLRKNGKPFVPDTLANSPFMQASPDKAPMPPERPKDLDKQAPTPPARPKDLNEISRNLARMVIRKASDEKEMGSKKDRSKAVVMAGKKAYSIPSEPKVRATNEEVVNENHVLYTHPKADIKVVRKGEGSKEGAAIEVHKGGKKVASGDYDHGADAFFVNVGGKGQKSFDSAKDIANHFHGMSEQFQQIDEMAPKGAKYERMVKHIKDKYSKDGKLSDKEKSIAYATAWKAKNKNMEEGLTAEQVMAEIRKNLGEAKMKKLDEIDTPPNSASSLYTPKEKTDKNVPTGDGPTPSQPEIDNPKAPGSSPAQPPATTAQSGQMPVKGNPEATPKPLPVIKNQDTGAPGQDPGDRGSSLSKPATPTAGSSMKNQGSGAPGQDPGDRVSSAPSKLPTFASGAPGTPKITPTPNVDKNVPTGGAPAAGAAALTKQTPRPATPSAAKPTAPAAAKDDIWDDSKIQRTGEGGTETAADFQRNSELYNKRNAAGGQRPAPEAPKPATPSASRPSASRPATPSAGSPNNPMTNSPDGPAPKMTNPTAAKRDGDGMTTGDKMPNQGYQGSRFRDTLGRPNDPRGKQNDTVGRPQTDKPGSYTRASSGSSDNPMASMAAGRAAERGTDSRTQVPASRILARKTKMNESLNDAITKILKG